MSVAKIWHLKTVNPVAAGNLSKALGIHPVTAQLLANRSIETEAEAQEFVTAKLGQLHPPSTLPGVKEATVRIRKAVETGELICIYGDYDVDGITGSATMWHTLKALGANVMYFVPHRMRDGYGVHKRAIHYIADRGTKLVVSVDCGITAVDEVELAHELGIDFIVTDHHEPKEVLPKADVLIHPCLPGREAPFTKLCGSGVAFKLAWSLMTGPDGKLRMELRDLFREALAMAALGTVADVVQLRGENRIIVREGLKMIQNTKLPGLRDLLIVSESPTILKAEDIAFKLAPRLNAAGRMDTAQTGFELLTTQNLELSHRLAVALDEHNKERKAVEARMTEIARQIVEETGAQHHSALVLASPHWHKGVMGIVASRMVEQYGRPVLMISTNDNKAMGSGRSVKGLALHESLKACEEYLVSHGGHQMAAGFRLEEEKIDRFREKFCEVVGNKLMDRDSGRRMVIDRVVDLEELSIALLEEIDTCIEPTGQGNPKPTFVVRGAALAGVKPIGDGRHLSFDAIQCGTTIRGVAFSMSHRIEELMRTAHLCSIAFRPRINEWRGRRTVQLEMLDFKEGMGELEGDDW